MVLQYGDAVPHHIHFPERTAAQGDVTSQPELITNQNSSQDRSPKKVVLC